MLPQGMNPTFPEHFVKACEEALDQVADKANQALDWLGERLRF